MTFPRPLLPRLSKRQKRRNNSLGTSRYPLPPSEASSVLSEGTPDHSGVPLCSICGEPIRHRRKGATRCLKHADVRKRTNRKKVPVKRVFVSVDGEATTKDGKYGLIGTSQGHFIMNRQGLSTEECLDFLLALPRPKSSTKTRRPIYVGFAIDYDVNMILGDLPFTGEAGSIEELRALNVTFWRGYRIQYFRRKIFRVSRGGRTFTWYDTWGYFQSSFEAALEKWKIPVPAIITEGKKARGSFHRWSLDKLREYNEAELAQHVELMNQLRDSIEPLDLTVRGWYGPAALAGYWLGKNGVAQYLVEPSVNLADAASRAYFGGRIDVRGYGIVEPVYHFDIVSAYPSATRFLPDLTKLKWVRTKGRRPEAEIYCARVRWAVPERTIFPPLPWRNNQGTIRYPLIGEGWYWNHEIEAMYELWPSCFQVIEAYEAQGEVTYPLKELIEETFAHRAKLKAEGNPSHVPVKLILNSIYGKFAQTVGKAQYYNLIWAGLITSYTRAMMMRAVDQKHTVLMMTDSLWSRRRPVIEDTSELGGWERGDETKLIVAQAGLYQSFKADGTSQVFQRGFDKRNPVNVENVVRAWLADPMDESEETQKLFDEWYEVSYHVRRFVGMGLASITNHEWRKWVDVERTIHPVPIAGTSKRWPKGAHDNCIREGDFVTLFPWPVDTEECSAPYQRGTQDPRLVAMRLEDECFDDGY